jgi:hypothetical protein
MKTFLTIFLFTSLIYGCSGSYDLPAVDSGMVEVHSSRGIPDQPRTVKLTVTQIEALKAWFSNHRTQWTRILEDTAPGTFVFLRHGQTNAAYVNVLGSNIYSGGRRRPLTPEERDEILTILGDGKRDENP